MKTAEEIVQLVQQVRARNAQRDLNIRKVIAIRKGDYEAVAPGLFNNADFDKPLVANMVDSCARDLAESFASLPHVSCQSAILASNAEDGRQELRTAIANGYIQESRLQDQEYDGADKFSSFGFKVYMVEPDFEAKMPRIRISDSQAGYYVRDFRGVTKQYFEVSLVSASNLAVKYPEFRGLVAKAASDQYAKYDPTKKLEIVRWYGEDGFQAVILLQPAVVLSSYQSKFKKCPVRVVARPQLTDETRGQFDDVIWVQIARALVQMYTMNALDQAVNAPIQIPTDADEVGLGPFTAIRTDHQVSRVNLGITPGLFPEFQTLAEELRVGARYPESRSGNMGSSIITGQGVEALNGVLNTQIQTYQRLNASALRDVLAMCFEMDETYWPESKKTLRVVESGAPKKITYIPSRDIAGDYSADVSYGAIGGMDPNRALVFVLQALGGGLLSKKTAMRTLPVELNVVSEERQIQLEQIDASIAAAIAMLPQALPQMAMQGQDPTQLVAQLTELRAKIDKGENPADAIHEVFAPKKPPPSAGQPGQPGAPDDGSGQQPPSPLDQAQGAGAGPAGLPGAGEGGAADLMTMLAGMNRQGTAPQMTANVQRQRPVPPQ